MDRTAENGISPPMNQRMLDDRPTDPVSSQTDAIPVASSPAASSMDRKIYAQAIDFIYQNQANIIPNLALMPLVAMAVMWSQVDHLLLTGWAAAGISVAVTRYLLVSAYLRKQGDIDSPRRWAHYYAISSFLSGLLWGSATLLFFIPDSVASQVFLIAMAIGLTIGTLVVTAYHLLSFYTFAIPAIFVTVSRLLMEGNLEYQGLALLLFVFLGIASKVAHNTHKSVIAAIRLRFENLDLIEQLRQQKEAAEQANQAKSKFLAAASHDLRQPLHALSLFTALLDSENSQERQKDLIGKINRSQTALADLLNTLLDISKLDAGIVEATMCDFELDAMLERLIPEFEPETREKGLYLQYNPSHIVVRSDPALLEIILRNLLNNAIRYTDKGGITVQVQKSDTTSQNSPIRIEVADTGIGIPLSRQHEIFQEFHQLANPERDRAKGLGLGLAIVRRVSELLKHDIELESRLGEGSTFFVILPEGNPEKIIATATEDISSSQYDLPETVVMFIDDEEEIRDGMQETLREWGCKTIVAASGDDAVLQIQQRNLQPDVILADYRLRGGENGADAIHQVCDEIGRKVPALIITGDTAPERLREAGASGYTLLHKPLQPAQIRAFVRHAVCPPASS